MAGFDRVLLGRRFSRAADRYAAVAALQREVESRLLEGLERMTIEPVVVLDVGSGPGRATGVLRKRFRSAQVIALDIAIPMLRQARRQGSWWHPVSAVCADAGALPLADGSVDLLFSSLCLQWLDDVPATLAEFRRVLRPGGLMLVTTFGPDTLGELRDAWVAGDARAHVSAFAPMAAVGDALMAQGFRDPVLDRDVFTLSYAALDDLIGELRAIGANNARRDRSRALTGKSAWRRMRSAYDAMRDVDGRYPATYEVIYVQAVAPDPGQPRRGAAGEIATIPVSSIRRRPSR
jgi:malonyl-CoA O-methyltransferase